MLSPLRPKIQFLVAFALSIAALTSFSSPVVASTLTFASFSSDGALVKNNAKLLQALSTSLSQKVVFQTRGTYEEVARAMHKGTFDIVSGAPSLVFENEALYEPVARPIFDHQSRYRGVIVVKSNSKFRSLKELQSARFGCLSERSMTGYFLPSLMLRAAGVNLATSGQRVRFYRGDMAAVIRAITRGEVDAGAVNEDAAQNNKQIRIIAYTRTIPTDPILVKKSLPLSLRLQIADFFSEAARRSDARDLLSSVDKRLEGWVRTDAKDYENIRRYQEDFFKGEKVTR